MNKIVIVILSLLLTACATVVPEKVQNRKFVDKIGLRFNNSAVTPDKKVGPYVYIHDGDKMSSEVVKEFILAYNRTYNTTFNVMRDVIIKNDSYFYASPVLRTLGYSSIYLISGFLLEIAREPVTATDKGKNIE